MLNEIAQVTPQLMLTAQAGTRQADFSILEILLWTNFDTASSIGVPPPFEDSSRMPAARVVFPGGLTVSVVVNQLGFEDTSLR
jgi:hypothetical protein